MKTTTAKPLAMALLLAITIGALAVVSGCANEAATSASADSDVEQSSATTLSLIHISEPTRPY